MPYFLVYITMLALHIHTEMMSCFLMHSKLNCVGFYILYRVEVEFENVNTIFIE